MALPGRKQSGAKLRAADFNAVRDAARLATVIRTGRGIEATVTPQGLSIALQTEGESYGDAIQAELTSATAGIIYGVVELYQGLEAYNGPELLQCRIPSQSGFSRLGILLQEVNQNKVAWVKVAGVCPLQYTGTVAVGGRLGGKFSSHFAQPDQGGPFRVLQLPEAGIAVVEIIALRLDAKMVDCDTLNAAVSGPYHTIIYKGFTVTETSPGKVTTT